MKPYEFGKKSTPDLMVMMIFKQKTKKQYEKTNRNFDACCNSYGLLKQPNHHNWNYGWTCRFNSLTRHCGWWKCWYYCCCSTVINIVLFPWERNCKEEWHYLNYRKCNRTLQHRGLLILNTVRWRWYPQRNWEQRLRGGELSSPRAETIKPFSAGSNPVLTTK